MDKELKQRVLWGASLTLMKKNKVIARIVYVSFSGFFLCLCLYLITQLAVFYWLTIFFLVCLGAIRIGGIFVNIKDAMNHKNQNRDVVNEK